MTNKFMFCLIMVLISRVTLAQGYSSEVGNGGSAATSNDSFSGKPRSSGCSPALKDLVKQDKENRLVVLKSQHDSCRMHLNYDKDNKTYVDAQNMSAAMSGYLTEFNGSLKSSAKSCTGQSDLSKEEQKEAVAKLYFSQAKLAEGQRGTLEAMANLGGVLKKDSWKNSVKCDNILSQPTKDLCEKAKTSPDCNKMPTVKDLASRQADAEKEIWDLTKQQAEFKTQASRYKNKESAEYKKYQEKIVDIDFMIARQKALIPWTEGDVYKKTVSCHRGAGCQNVDEAIKAQLESDLSALQNGFNKMAAASDCLQENPSFDCKAKDIRAALDLAPPTDPYNSPPVKQGHGAVALYEHLSEQQCMYNYKQDQLATGSVIQGAFIDAAIGIGTVLTGGIVGVVSKAAAEGAMSMKVAETTITAAKSVNLGLDLVGTSANVKAAVNKCFEDQTTNLKGKSDGGICNSNPVYNYNSSENQHRECLKMTLLAGVGVGLTANNARVLINDVKSGEQAVNAVAGVTAARSVTGQVMDNGKKVAGGTSSVVQDFQKSVNEFSGANSAESSAAKRAMLSKADQLDPAQRVQAAESVLGKELGKEQKDAVMAAHEVGKDNGHGFVGDTSNYTQAELANKIRILKKAGFNQDEISKLMRSGVTGGFARSQEEATKNLLLKTLERTKGKTSANDLNLRAEAMIGLKQDPVVAAATYKQAAAAFLKERNVVIKEPVVIASVNSTAAYAQQLKQFDSMFNVQMFSAASAMVKSGDPALAPKAALLFESSFRSDMKFNGAYMSEFKSSNDQMEFICARWRSMLDNMTPAQRSAMVPEVVKLWPGFRY